MSELPISEARDHLGEIVSKAEHAQERTVLTRHGKAVAAVISIDDLRELEGVEDEADLAAAQESLATPEQRVPHREVLAEYGIARVVRYEIEWTAPALCELRKLDKPLARRVLTAVTKLGVDPRPPGVRALTGHPAGTMRLRIGDYRVVSVVRDDLVLVTVVRIAQRREVYRDL